MRILYTVRKNWRSKFGGDVHQCKKYIEVLGRKGIKSEIVDRVPNSIDTPSIVHSLNIDRIGDTYCYYRSAKTKDLPFCFTPIHHSFKFVEEYNLKHARPGIRFLRRLLNSRRLFESVKNTAKGMIGQVEISGLLHEVVFGQKKLAHEILEGADRIFLLAESEGEHIERDYSIKLDGRKVRLTPNGVDLVHSGSALSSETNAFVKEHPKFALVVGRIEPRKNQLGIMGSLEKTKIPIVFAGGKNKNFGRYCEKFDRFVKNQQHLHYAGFLTQEQLTTLYKSAFCMILFSWFEVSPLVELEAYSHGCYVISTNRSYSESYGSKHFKYVDPSLPQSLAMSVSRIWDQNILEGDGLPNALRRFSWDRTTDVLANEYKALIGQKGV